MHQPEHLAIFLATQRERERDAALRRHAREATQQRRQRAAADRSDPTFRQLVAVTLTTILRLR